MLNIFSHPENANQPQWHAISQPMAAIIKISINKDNEKSAHSYPAGAGHFGKHGSYSKRITIWPSNFF